MLSSLPTSKLIICCFFFQKSTGTLRSEVGFSAMQSLSQSFFVENQIYSPQGISCISYNNSINVGTYRFVSDSYLKYYFIALRC